MAGNPVPSVAQLGEVTARHADAPARKPHADALALDECQDAQEGVSRRHRNAHCQRHELRHHARQQLVVGTAGDGVLLQAAEVGEKVSAGGQNLVQAASSCAGVGRKTRFTEPTLGVPWGEYLGVSPRWGV